MIDRLWPVHSRSLPEFPRIYAVPEWPPSAAIFLGEVLLIAEAPCKGATIIRARRTLRALGILAA